MQPKICARKDISIYCSTSFHLHSMDMYTLPACLQMDSSTEIFPGMLFVQALMPSAKIRLG